MDAPHDQVAAPVPGMRERPIVVIEDEEAILDVVEYNLERAGFRVERASDGSEGLGLVRRADPCLVVLDLMLPGMDGVELCRALRADPATARVPVLMLTARDAESDIVLGLGVGADDYVTKPFRPRELVARIQAILRRREPPPASAAELEDGDELDEELQRARLDGIVIDPARHEVLVDGRPVEFTRTELRLLHVLASRPGRVFTRDLLISRVMGHDAWVTDRTIDVHVRAIRRKLADRADAVETVRGVGYRARDPRRAG